MDPDQIEFPRKFGSKVDRGVTVIERETFESALRQGCGVLQELGFGAFRARNFRRKK